MQAVVAMGSLQEELARRQAEARQRIAELRVQLAEVQSRLEAEEDWLARLAITQDTVREVLGEPAAGEPVLVGEDADTERPREVEPETVRRGVVTVPPWEPELTASVLPQAYRDVLEVLTDAGGAMRSGKISVALGRGESAARVEALRSKLKRLVERGWLTENEPGLFAVAEQVRGQGIG